MGFEACDVCCACSFEGLKMAIAATKPATPKEKEFPVILLSVVGILVVALAASYAK